MKRRLTALLLGLVLAIGVAGTALAGGNNGYEGQPGNQSNGGGGNTGYEGQPGNQSH
jgi:hypothetical protein